MSVRSYRHDLAKALKRIQDKEAGVALWNFLYDWGNHLPVCVGMVELMLTSDNLDKKSLELLESLNEALRSLMDDMRGALVDYAEGKASDTDT